MRQSRFQEGVEKIIDFRDPFFSILADFCCPGGSKSLGYFAPFWLLFGSWGLIFLIGEHFWPCSWILLFWKPFLDDFLTISWHCVWPTRLHFVGKIRAEVASVLPRF